MCCVGGVSVHRIRRWCSNEVDPAVELIAGPLMQFLILFAFSPKLMKMLLRHILRITISESWNFFSKPCLLKRILKMGLFISPRQSYGGSNVECQVLDELLGVLETMTQLMLSKTGFGIILQTILFRSSDCTLMPDVREKARL